MRELSVLMLLAIVASKAIAGEPLTHCTEAEEVFYACEVEGSQKIVSLCGQSDAQGAPLWVQYRFGRTHRQARGLRQARGRRLAGQAPRLKEAV
ncbi:MAG: hypothetical protein U1F26_10935 [Lysobacterales bacterium]